MATPSTNDIGRFHWPPCRSRFLLAWVLFAIALGMRGFTMKGLDEPCNGVVCLLYGWQFLWGSVTELLLADHRVRLAGLYYGSLGLANSWLLASVLVAFILRGRPRFCWICAGITALATLDVLAWFVHTGFEPEITTLEGSVVWAASHITLTWAFVSAARKLGEPIPD